MSVDLDWSKLDVNLADSVLTILNNYLAGMPRPDFIGPISVTSLDFGTMAPNMELIDVKDVNPEFLQNDEFPETTMERLSPKQLDARYQHLPFHVRQGPDEFGAPPPPSPKADWTSDLERKEAASPSSLWPPLQLHFHLAYHSDLRLTMTTSLLINYPSPLFLSLPIKLHLTSMQLNAEVIIAFDSMMGKRRLHFCLVEESDPSMMHPSPSAEHLGALPTPEKPPPVGMRMLPQIVIESEIGDADKHALKNVSRVERFIQDAIRNLIVDELVFPNFQTIVFDY
ncbi:hypothetical protein DACRYDRAFT_81473 [Dacryopinax primogenitus]|uniref:Mitochondrial distribution and morphology protein 12 n=1 Tax=Dacryopinax primogenitus (strain DJM 731) TaxID=1858805 RepID=M5FW40_DACPD|nr:uncharacterized protein DACRYDRAFT_81473 [Dacryopinax primogenitus]EJT99874.1 hypothetical protein DACRYDRAFT_81473 [Dacryopinax primogenitus]